MSSRNRILPLLLWLVAAALLVQGALAGMFISGVADARWSHLILGSLLPYVSLVVAVVGGVHWARRTVTTAVGVGSVALPVVIWVQSALGHMPFATGTAVHVPLGIALVSLTVVLAGAARTRPRGGVGPPVTPAAAGAQADAAS